MKTIILSRVSTINQSLEQQTKELVEIAVKDGYDRKDIIVIENKESAIKNDEEHRLGLVEMKEAILNDPTINCVYCREVSRVGRRYDVLQSIKTFLVTNKIQLVVCGTTRIELLDKKGDITLIGGLMFEIACQSAIQEMEEKKLRFAQGKQKAMNEGRIASGKPIFGYYTDSNGIIRINEEEAEIVKYIFNTYVNTELSTKAIYRELLAQGKMKRYKNEETGRFQIQRIICNLAYSGGISNASGFNIKPTQINHYDAIVTEELQKKAIDKCKSAKSQPKSLTKNVYYAKSLVKCTCGHTMVANSSMRSYYCPYCKKTIPINHIDYIAWNESTIVKSLQLMRDNKADVENATNTIADNTRKIDTANARLVELDELEESIASTALMISNKDKRQQFISKKQVELTEERKKINNTILKLQETNEQFTQYLESLESDRVVQPMLIEDDNQRRELIASVIDSITLTEVDNLHTKITVIPKKSVYIADYPTSYIYDKSTMPYPKLIQVVGDVKEDVTKQIPKRFTYKKKRVAC